MLTVGVIRRDNLEMLVAEFKTLDEVAARAHTTSVYLSQIRNRTIDAKTGRPREMGSVIARRLESGCGKPVGWMDSSHSGLGGSLARATASEREPEYRTVSSGASHAAAAGVCSVAVVGAVRLLARGLYEELSPAAAERAGAGRLDVGTPDPAAYGLRVHGTAMFPAVRDGWYLLVEPGRTPREGDYVLLELQDGRRMLQELLYRRAASLECVTLTGGERTSIERAELRGLYAVGALVAPGKWRAG